MEGAREEGVNNALVPIVRTLDPNTRLHLNALDGVDDSQSDFLRRFSGFDALKYSLLKV